MYRDLPFGRDFIGLLNSGVPAAVTGLLGKKTAGFTYHQMLPLLEGVLEKLLLPALRSH